MSRFELSLHESYVPKWTIVDAVREIFQNALDQQIVSPDNKMFFEYNDSTETLCIGNKRSVLTTDSLLLGATTKANDLKTVGQFGEGYKIGSLVLLRHGKSVTIYNYSAREVWKAKLVKSRKYNGVKILVFDVAKNYIWNKPPHNDLIFQIDNINAEEYQQIVDSNLHLHPTSEIIETPIGDILLDPLYSHKIFVNGLFVCEHRPYKYGYNFKPGQLKLDRDRKLVSDFDTQWLSSKVWNLSGPDHRDIVIGLVKDGSADTRHVESTLWVAEEKRREELRASAYEDFRAEHGPKAIPVTSQSELESVIEKYTDAKPVIVPEAYKVLVTSSDDYKEELEERMPEVTLRIKFLNWLELLETTLEVELPQNLKDEFHTLVDELED